MFTNKLNSQAVITNKRVSKLPRALAIMSTSLMIGLSMASMSAQAAGLGELFANNGAAKSKFLPVDKAFQVISSTKATSKGTRLSINFDITPGHYVYKDQLTLSFPKGVSATPFTFSQSPVSIDDPTFGKVPVLPKKYGSNHDSDY